MNDKINKDIKYNLLTSLYLYFFLLTIPYFIILLGEYSISFKHTTIFLIAFFYSIISFIITLFTYKKTNNSKTRSIELRKGLLAVFTYFFTLIFEGNIIYLIQPDLPNLPLFIKTLYLSFYEIIQICIIVYILKDKLNKDIKDIKKNHKTYFSKYGKYYLLSLVVMFISSIAISLINPDHIAGNEQTIRELFSKAPIYMYFSAVIVAPILEELTFRQGIRNIFTNDKVFIIVSGLIFGGLHVIGNVNSPVDLLYLIPYSAPGIAFAYMLVKTKNIFTSMGFHFLHNGITMTLQLLLMFLGRLI